MAESYRRFLLECSPQEDGTYVIKERETGLWAVGASRIEARGLIIKALEQWIRGDELPVRSTEEVFLKH